MYLDTNLFILKTYLDTKYFSEKVSRYEDTWSDKLDNLADKKKHTHTEFLLEWAFK